MPTTTSQKKNGVSSHQTSSKTVFNIDHFHMNHILPNSFLVIIGENMADSLVLDYLDYNLDLPIGLVITQNFEAYEQKVPSVFHFSKLLKKLCTTHKFEQSSFSSFIVYKRFNLVLF